MASLCADTGAGRGYMLAWAGWVRTASVSPEYLITYLDIVHIATTNAAMKASLATSLAVLSAAATVRAAPSSHAGVGRRQNDCPPVHVFGARETTAPPGFGASQAVVDSIVQANEGATSEAIIYPAAGGADYASSVTAGIGAVVNQTMSFRLACPATKLVMVGYAQVRPALRAQVR